MTTEQVAQVAGRPNRLLSARQTEDGFQQVLEYRTSFGEIYALEFWDNYLTGFEYVQDDIVYVAPIHPPMHFPPYGRPIYIINNRPPQRPNRPNRPNRPSQPSRPSTSNRPSQPGRPSQIMPLPEAVPGRPTTQNRPGAGGSSQNERPVNTNRPGQSTTSTPDRSTLTRPAETTGRGSGSSTENSNRSSGTRENTTNSRSQ